MTICIISFKYGFSGSSSGDMWESFYSWRWKARSSRCPARSLFLLLHFSLAEGKLNTFGVIAAGTFGSWLGATATYWAALWLGRVFIGRWGRYFLLSEHKLERAERWIRRYEAGGIFFARLLPVIRHVISIPAGIIRMNFATFSVMTLAGSALWCSVLAWFGQKVLTREMIESKDATALIKAVKESGNFHTIVIACVVITVLYLLVVSLTGKKRRD